MNSEPTTTVEIYRRLRQTLRRADAFDNDASLLATFQSDPRLQPWQDLVPDALNRAERVRLTVAALQDRRNNEGQAALILLLHALRDQVDVQDQLHVDLMALAGELAQRLAPPPIDDEPDSATPLPPAPGRSPFKGLFYYDIADADDFYGREALTATLLTLLPPRKRDAREASTASEGEGEISQFLAVVGPSGSGKTSLLRAGLVASMQDAAAHEPLSGIEEWPTYIVTPTGQPLERLAAALTFDAESVRVATGLVDDMRAEPRSLALFAHRLLQDSGASRLLLVVDQLEELFTLCSDDAVRSAYLQNLITACLTGPVIVVTALRSDFYEAAGRYEPLRDLLSRRQVYIGPMSVPEVRKAIEAPAHQNGWRFEPGLVERILQDVAQAPGALPLLSQALHETWERRQGHTLTHAGYIDAGGVRGSIARAAEETYAGLDAAHREAARAVLLRLVVPANAPLDVRGQVGREELGGSEITEETLRALARGHLLAEDEGLVSLAHEALIREWPRLRQWLQEAHQQLRLHRRLTIAAHQWRDLQRHADATYRGTQLQQAQQYAAAAVIPLSPLEIEFLRQSELVARQQQAEQESRLRAAWRVPAAGALGGAAGYALAFWLMYRRLIDVQGLLVAFVVFQTVIGGAAGAGFVWRMEDDTVSLSGSSSQDAWRRRGKGAAAGALVFGAFLLAHAVLTRNMLLPAVLEGALWGAVTGAGWVWLRQSQRPLWQTAPLLALACALTLLLADQLGRAFSWEGQGATLATIFITGGLTPLAILLATYVASGVTRRDAVAQET